jgi:phosphoribosylformimino-5-aminoimidazole carboxamide ribotide isomerase
VGSVRLASVELYPAVDILGGRAVRLERGDFERRSEYADDPLDAARHWVEQGARRLHVVDLDGARGGEPVNLDHLRRIGAELGGALELLQFGGGLRSAASARAALDAGAGRIVIGTAAFGDPALLDELLAAGAGRIAVGVDVREGRVAVHGWQERTEMEPAEAIRALVARGVRTIVHTDVDRDGTLTGVDAAGVREIAEALGDARLVSSGGVASLADLLALAGLGLPNLEGVIVGKALYERRFTVAEATQALTGGAG